MTAAKEKNQFTFIDGMNLFLECLEDQDSSGERDQPIDLKRYIPQILQRRINCLSFALLMSCEYLKFETVQLRY